MDNPLHIIGFLSQWKLYLDELPADPQQEFRGRKLDPAIMEKVWVDDLHSQLITHIQNTFLRLQMSAEQLGQVYELMHATKDAWKPVSELQGEHDDADPSH